VVDVGVLVMAITMPTVGVRKTLRAVRKGPGKGRQHRMGRGRDGD